MTEVDQDISLGEFVKRLAASLQQEGAMMPFKNQRPWHLLVYELAKTPSTGRPKFLDELIFDWDAPYPKCQELSEFLHALHFTASVSASNPSYDAISVDDELAELWSQPFPGENAALKDFIVSAVERAKETFAEGPTE